MIVSAEMLDASSPVVPHLKSLPIFDLLHLRHLIGALGKREIGATQPPALKLIPEHHCFFLGGKFVRVSPSNHGGPSHKPTFGLRITQFALIADTTECDLIADPATFPKNERHLGVHRRAVSCHGGRVSLQS